ncbi:hypothetical protein [Pedobacter sp.]|uniref:hypothetical protein n=1 Tax=Pedobacter sp. TaxID=1411316 RepID=UPI003BAA8BA7
MLTLTKVIGATPIFLSDVNGSKKNLFLPPSYSKHYIAPAPWQYWSKANEIVITTSSSVPVSGTIKKSDGTFLTNFTVSQNTPFIHTFSGLPKNAPAFNLNTVITGGGIIVEATGSIAVNVRNIASDNLGTDGNDANIKGNASLFSFGDAAIGKSFRVGYYRAGNLSGTPTQPIYSIMAIENNTVVKIGGVVVATLNAGQSYLFKTPIGTLIESSDQAVMNTGAMLDAPRGCGDGTFNPIPPVASLGKEYVIVRGEGNIVAEQSTIIAVEPNTKVVVTHFDANGMEKSKNNYTLVAAGNKVTFNHGYLNGAYNISSNTGRYSSSFISADKNIEVFSGTAGISYGGGCEVDIATLAPISACSGSKSVETTKFTSYSGASDLPYFGYIVTKNPDKIYLTTQGGGTNYTNKDIETIAAVGVRKPLGSSGLSLISFTSAQIGSPKNISISSTERLTVSMVQQSSASSMSNFISRFPEKAEQPVIVDENCASVKLVAVPNAAPYQWYLNDLPIDGANSDSYLATVSGSYSLTYQLDCGLSAPSLPVKVSVCVIDRAITKSVDIAYPDLNSNVVFNLKAENLGNGIAVDVLVMDKLPAGYSYVSSIASTGTMYDPVTGIWSIGQLGINGIAKLDITAKVIQTGLNTNTVTISGPQPDLVINNDHRSVSTSTKPADTETCVDNPIAPIVYNILPNTTAVNVHGLPAGLGFVYNPVNSVLTISGTPTVAGPSVSYNVIGTSGAAINFEGKIKINPLPSLTLFADPVICEGTNMAALSYSNLMNNPISYSINWNSAGFSNVIDQGFPPGDIPLNIPLDATVGSHSAILTIKTSNGCKNQFNFNVDIKPKPLVPHVPVPVTSQY